MSPTDNALLSLERLAETLAYLEVTRSADHPRVLEKLELTKAQLEAAQTACAAAFASALVTGKVDPILTFSRTYALVSARFRVDPPVLEAIQHDTTLAATPIDGVRAPVVVPPAPVPAAPVAAAPAAAPAVPAPPAAAAVPAPSPSNPGLPEFTLEQYAWVVACMRRARPEDIPALLQRFRLTPDTRAAVDARWQAWLAQDQRAAAAFQTALYNYLNPPAAAPAPAPVSSPSPTSSQPASAQPTAQPMSPQAPPAPAVPAPPAPPAPATPAHPLSSARRTVGIRDDMPLQNLGLLPFREDSEAAGLAKLASSMSMPRRGVGGMTIAPNSKADQIPALPFPKANEGLIPLADYARITASLTKEGNPDETFKKFGIDPGEWMSVVRGYSRKFSEDAAAQAEFDRLMKEALG